MITLTQIATDTYQLVTALPRGGLQNSVYFIVEKESAVLIEPGPAIIVPRIRQAIKQLGIEKLSHIIPTHIHMDHSGGTGDLAALYPKARVVLHPRAARHAVDPTRLIAATKLASGDDFADTHGEIASVPASQIDTALDGEMIDTGSRHLQIIHTPGHATHQLAIFDRKTGALFCGEALGIPRPDEESALPSVSIPELDAEAYLATIDKLRHLEPGMLCYSHEEGTRQPEPIISRLAENVALIGEIVLDGLTHGDDQEKIRRRTRHALDGHFQPGARLGGLRGIVEGYTNHYYRKDLANGRP